MEPGFSTQFRPMMEASRNSHGCQLKPSLRSDNDCLIFKTTNTNKRDVERDGSWVREEACFIDELMSYDQSH